MHQMDELIANILVAVIRRHVDEAYTFLDEAFGQDVDQAHEMLAQLATGQPDAAKDYWANMYEEIFVRAN